VNLFRVTIRTEEGGNPPSLHVLIGLQLYTMTELQEYRTFRPVISFCCQVEQNNNEYDSLYALSQEILLV
jgi:hypothetical protein